MSSKEVILDPERYVELKLQAFQVEIIVAIIGALSSLGLIKNNALNSLVTIDDACKVALGRQSKLTRSPETPQILDDMNVKPMKAAKRKQEEMSRSLSNRTDI